MYKYLPYALGLQEYVLEPAPGMFMPFAQRWLFAPPFVVSFPYKANERKYEITLNCSIWTQSCIIIVEKVTKKQSWHSLQDQGSALQSHLQNLYIDVYIGSLK